MSALREAVCAATRRAPDAPAFRWQGESVPWRHLRTRAASAGAALRRLAPGAETRVIALTSGSAFALAAFAYACAFADLSFLPLNPALPRERREALLAAAGSPIRFGEGGLDPAPVLDAFSRTAAAAPEGPAASREGEVELVIATSGSGGEPKGVMLSPGNLRAAARASAERLPLAPGDVWLACLSLYHIGGMAILHRCARGGAAVLLHQGFDAARVLEDLGRYCVTHLSLVPPMLDRLVHAGPPPPALRAALVGGGELSAPLFRRARRSGWPVMPTYGLTETCAQVATQNAPGDDWAPGEVGGPLPGITLDIAGADAGGLGRIRVRGATVMRGYLNPGLRPGQGGEEGVFLTADLGRLDQRGHLIVLGRADDMLISGGVNVHPAEAERLLLSAPGLAEVAVTGRRDPVWGEVLVAVYRGDTGAPELDAWCRQHLPGHLRPRDFLQQEALPFSPQGKLDRLALRRLAEGAGQKR